MFEYPGLWMFPVLFVFIIFGFPIAFSLITVGFLFGIFQFGDAIIYQLVAKVTDVSSNSILAAIPLFIFMGALLESAKIAEKLFDAIHLWTHRIPGGLGVGTILMGTIFAAASGVVGATETVIGLLAIPIMLKHAYDKKLISGTICAGGSLGTVIPPSITVIVLAPVANVSVGDLFAGLLFPGLIMASLFIFAVIAWGLIDKNAAPSEEHLESYPSLYVKIKQTVFALIPPMLLIFSVLGTILFGLATPTEAAASGAIGTIVLTLVYRQFTKNVLLRAMKSTVSITAMILLIVLGGNIFAGVFFASGGMAAVQNIMGELGLPGWGVIAAILAMTFFAGFMLDLISVVLIIIPVAMPIIKLYGFDEIWFCVAFLVMLQTSYLTPPMAPSIFYLRAISPPSITLTDMYKGVLPFIAMQLVTLGIVLSFPRIVTWFPEYILSIR